jgi:hypothetical protein
MGLDLKLMALGYMGEPVYEQTWRSQWPIAKLIRIFEKEVPYQFEEGTTPLVLSGETMRCVHKFLCDPDLTLNLWDHEDDDEYYQDVLVPIRDQFKEAIDLNEKRRVSFLFYMSY